jgi:hypothetical protein
MKDTQEVILKNSIELALKKNKRLVIYFFISRIFLVYFFWNNFLCKHIIGIYPISWYHSIVLSIIPALFFPLKNKFDANNFKLNVILQKVEFYNSNIYGDIILSFILIVLFIFF